MLSHDGNLVDINELEDSGFELHPGPNQLLRGGRGHRRRIVAGGPQPASFFGPHETEESLRSIVAVLNGKALKYSGPLVAVRGSGDLWFGMVDGDHIRFDGRWNG